MTPDKDLLERLYRMMFPGSSRADKSLSLSSDSSSSSEFRYLPVERKGSYRYSIVPTIDDFARIRQDIFDFQIDDAVLHFLRSKYGEGKHGFVVCLLDQDATYEPFGFIHLKPSEKQLHTPTMHFHTHPTPSGFMGKMLQYLKTKFTRKKDTVSDWDHRIYVVNHSFPFLDEQKQVVSRHLDLDTSHGRSVCQNYNLADPKLQSSLEIIKNIHYYQITNYDENCDLIATKYETQFTKIY